MIGVGCHDILNEKLSDTKFFRKHELLPLIAGAIETKLEQTRCITVGLNGSGNRSYNVRVVPIMCRGEMHVQVCIDDVTQCVYVEETLRESEAKFRTLVEQAADGIFIADRDGNLTLINPQACRMLGYSEDELRGMPIALTYPPEDRQIELPRRKSLSVGDTAAFERSMVCKDGSRIPVEVRLTMLESGGYQGIVHDITERRRLENSLREDEALLRSFFDSPGGMRGIVEIVDGDILQIADNSAAAAFYGQTPESMRKKLASELGVPQHVIRMWAGRCEESRRANAPVQFDHFHNTSGERRWLSSVVSYLGTAESGRPRFAYMTTEVTDSKRGAILQSATYAIAQAANNARSLDGLYKAVHDIIATAMPAGNFYLAMYDADEDLISYPYFVDELDPKPQPRKPGKGLTEYVLRTGKPLLCDEAIDAELRERGEVELIGSPSPIWLGVPLLAHGKATGVMAVQHYTDPHAYGRRELELLEYVSAEVGNAIARRRAENALRESEENHRTTFENTGTATALLEANTVISLVNTEFERLSGYTKKEIEAKKRWTEFVAPEDLDRMLAQHRLRRGNPAAALKHYDFRFITKSGDVREIALSIDVIPGTGRSVAALLDVTERRQTEEALRRAEAKYRNIYENAVMGIYQTTRDGTWLSVNPMMARMCGYESPDELMASVANIADQFYADPGRRAEFTSLLENRGYVLEFESRAFRKDGSIMWISENVRAVRDSSGTVTGFEGTAIDITGRRKSDDLLKQQSAAMNASLDGIAILDAAGTYVYLNDAHAKVYGFACPDELIGKSWHVLYTLSELKRFTADIMPALSREGHWQGVARGRRKDGIEFPQELSLSQIEGGGIICVVRDISERVRAQDILRQSEGQFRLISENVTDMIAVLDLEGRRLYNSPSYRQLLGDMEHLRGTDSFSEIHPDDRARIVQVFNDTVKTGEGQRAEYRLVAQDGTTRDIESQGSTIKDKNGNVVNVIVVSRDVTEKKRVDQQLLRAQRMESIGRLASGIAHDLNNVLSPILMSIDVIRMKMTDPGGLKLLETIEASAKRGSDIVKQVLAFGRGVQGERILLQPKHVVGEVVRILNETFPKSVEIRTDIPKDLWTIQADPTQMHQVLLNVCVNARDAMADGGTLTLSAENVIADDHFAQMHVGAKVGLYVAVCITDTGSGIPANLLERIFEPFFTTKEAGSGTGLGLSITHAIVKSHGGFIDVYSEVHKGTTFKLYFPGQRTVGLATTGVEKDDIPQGHGELILVVDDEPSIRVITQRTLETNGYKVVCASNGAEAVGGYAQQKEEIDAVIIDMMMPIMDGPATIHALRKINPEVRLIGTSGFIGEGPGARPAEIAPNAFLTKPYSAKKLLRALGEALHGDARNSGDPRGQDV